MRDDTGTRTAKGRPLSTTHGDVAQPATAGLLSRANLARAVTLALALAYNVTIARALGAHDAGPVFTAVIVVTLVAMVGRLGSDLYVLKHASALRARGRLTFVDLRWGWLRRLCWSCSAVAALVVLGAALLANRLSDGGSALAAVLPWFALSIPFQCSSILNSALLRAVDRSAAGAFAEVGLSQGLAMLGLLALWATSHATPTTAALAFLGGSVLTAIWSTWRVRTADVPPGVGNRLGRVDGALGEMTRMMASSTLFYTMTWMPVGALWFFSTSASISLFTVAARFPNLLNLIPNVQITAAVPRLATRYHSDDIAGVNAGLARLNRSAAAVAVPATLVLMLGAPLVMAAFGPDFGDGVGALRVLCLGQLAVVLLGFVVPVMLFADMERVAVTVTIGAVVVGFPVICVASHYAGALGAAVGVACALAAHAAVAAFVIRKRTGVMTAFTLRPPRTS